MLGTTRMTRGGTTRNRTGDSRATMSRCSRRVNARPRSTRCQSASAKICDRKTARRRSHDHRRRLDDRRPATPRGRPGGTGGRDSELQRGRERRAQSQRPPPPTDMSGEPWNSAFHRSVYGMAASGLRRLVAGGCEKSARPGLNVTAPARDPTAGVASGEFGLWSARRSRSLVTTEVTKPVNAIMPLASADSADVALHAMSAEVSTIGSDSSNRSRPRLSASATTTNTAGRNQRPAPHLTGGSARPHASDHAGEGFLVPQLAAGSELGVGSLAVAAGSG